MEAVRGDARPDHRAGRQRRLADPELMDDVAAYLDMPEVSVYEVATFYGMYDLEPQGRHKVCVCNSVSCLLLGSEELIEHVEHKYDVRLGETTADGRFTFKEVECLGACRHAPRCWSTRPTTRTSRPKRSTS
jgi:NADH:ubiquinone oxidoreductase subunit E